MSDKEKIKIDWNLDGSSESFADVPENATILYINDQYVIGECESCGRHIIENEKYNADSDGVIWCEPECETVGN